MRTFLLIACPLLALAVAAPARAGQIADLAREAEAGTDGSDGLAAYEKMRQAMAAMQEKIPFNIRKAFFVSEKPVMFGAYSRTKSNEFPLGASLITYVEPVGLAWKPTSDGRVRAQFTVDFELRNPAGEVLAAQTSFGNFAITSIEPLFEIYAPLTLDVSQAPKGDYALTYTFTDQTSKKTSTVEQRFMLK